MRRLEKWMMILSKFKIQYFKHKAIKAKDIIVLLVEFPMLDNPPMLISYLMHPSCILQKGVEDVL